MAGAGAARNPLPDCTQGAEDPQEDDPDLQVRKGRKSSPFPNRPFSRGLAGASASRLLSPREPPKRQPRDPSALSELLGRALLRFQPGEQSGTHRSRRAG